MLPFKPTAAQKRVLGEIAARHGRAPSHEPPAAGRRRQRQDARGRRGRHHRHRKRLPGRRCSRPPKSWPPSTISTSRIFSSKLGYTVAMLTGSQTAREKVADQETARRRARRTSCIGTHALLEEDVEFQQARPRHRRRAAPLRRHAAPQARRERPRRTLPRRAGHDRDSHPPHPRAHHLRRSRRLRHRRTAARPQAHRHQTRHRGQDRAGLQLPEDSRSTRAAKATSSTPSIEEIRNAGHEGRQTDARASLRNRLPRSSPSACCTASFPADRERGRDGRASKRGEHRNPGLDHRDRGRRRRPQRHRDGDRAGRALRPRATPPAARPRRPRRRPKLLHPGHRQVERRRPASASAPWSTRTTASTSPRWT